LHTFDIQKVKLMVSDSLDEIQINLRRGR